MFNVMRLRVRVIKKERKYNLIWPFWLEIRVDVFIWNVEIDFGRAFSSQVRSSSIEATFWLISKLISGCSRCMTVGK